MAIPIRPTSRPKQWLGVALAAGLLAVVMWRHEPKPVVPAPTNASTATATDRSFDELSAGEPPGAAASAPALAPAR